MRMFLLASDALIYTKLTREVVHVVESVPLASFRLKTNLIPIRFLIKSNF